MSKIRKIAQRIRHAPGLEQAEVLWNLLRKPYHQFLNSSGTGVTVSVGEGTSCRPRRTLVV